MKYMHLKLLAILAITFCTFAQTFSAFKQIAFDLDGVVLRRDWPETRQLIKEHLAVIFCAQTGKSWQVAICYLKPGKEKPTGEELLVTLNNKNAQDKVRMIVDSKTMIPGMQTIIEELHTAGYTLTIATNQTREAFDRLLQKPTFAKLFQHFDLEKSQFAQYHPTVKKPSKEYFIQYLAKNNALQPSEILFVDDQEKNVIAARACGIDSVVFTSVEQFKKALIKKGILA